MSSIGKLMISTGEIFDYEKRLEQMNSVTMQDFVTFCKNIFSRKPSIAYVGKDIKIDLDKFII